MAIEALWLLGGGITLAVFALLGVVPKANIGAFHAGSRKRPARDRSPRAASPPADEDGGRRTPPNGDDQPPYEDA